MGIIGDSIEVISVLMPYTNVDPSKALKLATFYNSYEVRNYFENVMNFDSKDRDVTDNAEQVGQQSEDINSGSDNDSVLFLQDPMEDWDLNQLSGNSSGRSSSEDSE